MCLGCFEWVVPFCFLSLLHLVFSLCPHICALWDLAGGCHSALASVRLGTSFPIVWGLRCRCAPSSSEDGGAQKAQLSYNGLCLV